MENPQKNMQVIENVIITDFTEDGKGVGRSEGRVIFVSGALPGDVVDARVLKTRKNYIESDIQRFIKKSPDRIDPPCRHFGLCGGCKWQAYGYKAQLAQKDAYAKEQLERLGQVKDLNHLPIVGASDHFGYRNKMEYSFTDSRWLLPHEMHTELPNRNALGFHVPGRFDKIFHVEECLLMANEHNQIRNRLHKLAESMQLSYYNPRSQKGYLRNVIIRSNRKNEWMLTLVVGEEKPEPAIEILENLCAEFSFIRCASYTINTKRNDSIADLQVIHLKSETFLEENLGDFRFRISPQSFFQTNAKQAENLYDVVKKFAGLTGNEVLYDLYSGTGSIGIYLSAKAKKIVGMEYVEQATRDAKMNAELNGINHAAFYAGDLKDLLKPELLVKEGAPDVIVADPPRAGMHADVIEQIKLSGAHTLVYVSCNVSTQARDLALLSPVYTPVLSQAVDMFPQTGHLENVIKLVRQN